VKPSKNSEPAKAIGTYLKNKGHPVPHTLILEALARAGGYQNRHQARAEAPEPASTPPQQTLEHIVYVCVIDHRMGSDISVHATHADAFAGVVSYVNENWESELGDQNRDGLTNEDLVTAYFEAMQDQPGRVESFDIEKRLVRFGGAAATPTIETKRPEFANPHDATSVHETLAALLAGSESLGAEHRANIDKIRTALTTQKAYTPLWLASHLLEEHGMQIIVTCSVDDIEESLEGTLDQGAEMPSRDLISSALRHFSNKSGISTDATDAMMDEVQRTVLAWQKEDAQKPATSQH
jgi:hypothetical protein